MNNLNLSVQSVSRFYSGIRQFVENHPYASALGAIGVVGMSAIVIRQAMNPINDVTMITQNVSDMTRFPLIEALVRISSPDREHVAQQMLRLITNNISAFDAFDRIKFIEALAAIPSHDREYCVQQVLLLNNVPASNRLRLIEALVAISYDERERFVQVLRLMPENMNAMGGRLIIAALVRVPSHDREHVMQQALRLIPDNGVFDQLEYIQIVAAIPFDERERFVQQTLLLTQEMNENQRRLIMEDLAAIPSNDRDRFVQQVLQLITPDMAPHVRFAIIRDFAAFSSHDREAIVQQIFDIIRQGQYSQHEISLILSRLYSGQNIAQPNRDDPVTLTQQLQSWAREFEVEFPDYERPTTDFAPLLTSLNENEAHNLNVFLGRIQSIISDDINPLTDEARLSVIRRVENMIQLACVNPVFKEKMLTLIEQGLTDCGDRVLLIFNDIEVQYRLHHNVGSQDGPFIPRAVDASLYYLVKQHAIRIAREKGLGDEVETILGYQIGLRNDLLLPISTPEMLYPDASGVTLEMLAEAKRLLESYTTRQLVERSEDWQERMCQKFPGEAQEIRNKFGAILAGANKYYQHLPEERAAWLQQWLTKHPDLRALENIVANEKIKNCIDAAEAVREAQGIEFALMGGILDSFLPLRSVTHKGK